MFGEWGLGETESQLKGYSTSTLRQSLLQTGLKSPRCMNNTAVYLVCTSPNEVTVRTVRS